MRGSCHQILIFFHGNGEDLGTTYEFCDNLRSQLDLNVLAVEYPGYGVYEDKDGSSEEKILRDAELVYNFVLDMTRVEEKDILIMGRSLGSGPATHLAAKYNPGHLLLMSPMASLKSVATSRVGFFAFLVADKFNNLNKMHQVSCPTFIVHGQRDKIIPIEQAHQLKDRCFGPCKLLAPALMTHNRWDIKEDLI